MLHEIKKLRNTSVIRMAMAFGLVIGIVLDVLVFVTVLISGATLSNTITYQGVFGKLSAPANIFLLLFPIVACITSTFFGLLTAVIYNWIAKILGGIEYYTNESS